MQIEISPAHIIENREPSAAATAAAAIAGILCEIQNREY